MKAILPAILSCQGTALSDEEKYFFAKSNPLGINLFARNIANKEQIKTLLTEIKTAIGRDDVLIAIDQEGGRVRRLAEPEFRSYTSAFNLGSLPLEEAKKACTLHSRLIAADLQELGINVNYTPVLDVLYPETTDALRSRCFSDNEKTVATLGKTCVEEYINCGISPCIKHMPGHGRTHTDPHLNLPVLDNSLQELAKDFYPFQVCKDSPCGMTAHVVVTEIDNTLPVTQSKKAIDTLIRGIIGFQGLLISDAIDMKALRGSSGQKAQAALEAGCDCVCYAFGKIEEMQDIAALCPSMTEQALERYQSVKAVWNKQISFANLAKDAQDYLKTIGNIEGYKETYDATEVLNNLLKGDN